MVTKIVVFMVVITSIAFAWNHRIGNPGMVDVKNQSCQIYGGIEIYFPVQSNSLWIGYYSDGGTIASSFIDDKGNKFRMSLDHRMGRPASWGDVYITTDASGKASSINIGKDIIGQKTIYSLALLDDKYLYSNGRAVDYRWPKLGDIIIGYARDLLSKIGLTSL